MSAVNNIIFHGLIAVLAIGILLTVISIMNSLNIGSSLAEDGSGTISPTNEIINSNNIKYLSILTGTTSSGDIAIELKPEKITDDELIISISANTHSVDLQQFNLKEKVKLIYNNEQIVPIEAPGLSGHHSSGLIKFSVSGESDKFKIIIKDMPKIYERIYEW